MPTETSDALLFDIDLAEIFEQAAPLVLDLGCGNGVFLSAIAERCPGFNYLGVEKKAYRVRQTGRRIAGFPNAAVRHGEVVEVLRGLPVGSVAAAYLLFSDPWPKRRHENRRLVQEDFFDEVTRVIGGGGEFLFASDAKVYCEAAKARFGRGEAWEVGDWEISEDWPRTEFEQRFLDEGLEVWRFRAVRKGVL